jgi:DNA ligase (NAD+)
MANDSVKERIAYLREKINEYNYHYYDMDSPIISDTHYDNLIRELEQLERMHPEYYSDESPTQIIGGGVQSRFEPVYHTVKMDSLQDAFSFNELDEFDRRIRQKVTNPIYVVEPKIDGVSVSLEYLNGSFERGSTRGDGYVGEDVSENLRHMDSIPKTLRHNIPFLEVRGEVYIAREDFEALLDEQIRNQKIVFKNPRNAAAGSLRQKDPLITAERRLSVAIFNVQQIRDHSFVSHSETLEFLKQIGLPIITDYKTCSSMDEVKNHIEYIDKRRQDISFEIDGAVVKLDDLTHRELMGSTMKYPRWAIAYKYPAQQKSTVLLDVEVQVGRTGALTPTAVFEPVILAGTTVTRASLHNQDFIDQKEISIGDSIIVQKAGEIIPEVIGVLEHSGKEVYKLPDFCPSCNHPVIRMPDDFAVRCYNIDCPAQRLRHLIHFASKDAMDIKGLGEALAARLFETGLVSSADELYGLDEKKLAALPRMGLKSAKNLLDAIETSKSRDLSRLLYAMGIRTVGLRASQIISMHFGSIDRIINADIAELSSLDGIGEVIASNIKKFFSDSSNIQFINKLHEFGLNTRQIPADAVGDGVGRKINKLFVITGTLPSLSRSQAGALIEKNGGRITDSVSKSVDFIVVGDNPGSKLKKADLLDIPILDEKGLLKLLSE